MKNPALYNVIVKSYFRAKEGDTQYSQIEFTIKENDFNVSNIQTTIIRFTVLFSYLG